MNSKLFLRGFSTIAHRAHTSSIKSIASWGNKIIVNNFQLPNFMKVHGPSGDKVLENVNLTGKTCLITGGTSGIGLEMTRCLLKKNCNILMACRNIFAAHNAGKGFCADNILRPYEMNLASLKSVKKCSEKLLEDKRKIDIVIMNAGVFGIPWTLTEDALETIFQVNYLSQFYLLLNIEKLLAPNARVVFVSSESHRNVKWTLHQTLALRKKMVSLPYDQYTSIRAFNISKLCLHLAMRYLGYRWLNTGKSVFCAHPGSFVKTNLCSNWLVYEALYSILQPFTKSISQAAATPLYCATSPDLDGLSSIYYKDCKETADSELAQDSHVAFRMYELTQTILRDHLKVADTMKVTDNVQVPVKVMETEPMHTIQKQKLQKEQPKKHERKTHVEERLISNYN